MMNAERACMKTTTTAFALCVLLAAPATTQRSEPDWPADRRRDAAALSGVAEVRHERPSRQRASRGRLSEAGARARGHSGRDLRAAGPPAERGRASERQRIPPSAPPDGAHGCRQRRSGEVDPSAVRRRSRRRLHLRARHARRQRQPDRVADGHADAEAPQCAVGARRDLPRRGRAKKAPRSLASSTS